MVKKGHYNDSVLLDLKQKNKNDVHLNERASQTGYCYQLSECCISSTNTAKSFSMTS